MHSKGNWHPQKKNPSSAVKHKDTASGSGSSWATSRCKLGEYARKISSPLWVAVRHGTRWTLGQALHRCSYIFFIFSLVTGNTHNKFEIIRSKIQRHDFVTVFDKSMHLACIWMALQGKGSLTKLRTSFSKSQFSEALEGTYASLKYLAQTAATVHRSREAPQQCHWQAKPQIKLCNQLQEVLTLLGRQGRLPSSSYVFILPNTDLSSVKKKTHLIFLHLHSKPNDSNKEQKRIDEQSQNKNLLKSLAERFASYLATERHLLRV